eukprot:4549659-Alexandrium_andersonii.AAC.1
MPPSKPEPASELMVCERDLRFRASTVGFHGPFGEEGRPQTSSNTATLPRAAMMAQRVQAMEQSQHTKSTAVARLCRPFAAPSPC